MTSVTTPLLVHALRKPGSDGGDSADSVFITSHERGKEVIYVFAQYEDAELWAESEQARLGFLPIPEQILLRDLSQDIDIARCLRSDASSVDIPLDYVRETPYQTLRREFEERNRGK
jgi:hypothetical protein